MRRLRSDRATARLVWAAALGAALIAPVAADAGPHRAARWVAADAVIFAEVERPADLIDRATGAPAQAFLASIPSLQRAMEGKDYREFRAAVDLVTAELEMTWEQALRELTAGGVAFAVEAAEAGKEPAAYLFITPKDGALLKKAHDTLIDLARKDAKANDRPDPVREREHRGVTGYSLHEKEAHAIVDDTLVIANGGDALKVIIDRIRDGWDGPTVAEAADWQERRRSVAPDATAWGAIRLDRARELDAKRFGVPDKVDPGAILLFGPWIETYRKAGWLAAGLTWNDSTLSASLVMPTPEGGLPDPLKAYVPGEGKGAPAPLRPPGVIASLNLWRDLSAIWEVRAELFPPEFVQGLAQLDTFAGQFFGGRDFATGVLGALTSDWRIVVARQDEAALAPVPDIKLPGFALVLGLRPDDDDFAQRLKVAFQSFIGLANLGAAETKAPPLELGSEAFEGGTIATAKFMPPKVAPPAGEPVHYRHNFSPSAVQVGDHFVISSSLGLARDLIKELKAPAAPPTPETLRIEADGAALAGLVAANRERLVMQNMLEKGNDKAKSEEEVAVLEALLRGLGKGVLTVDDAAPTWDLKVDFALGTVGK